MRRPRLRKLLRQQFQQQGSMAHMKGTQAIDDIRGPGVFKNPVIQVSHFVRVLKHVDEMLMHICGLFVQTRCFARNGQSKAIGGAKTGKYKFKKQRKCTQLKKKANAEGNASIQAIERGGKDTAFLSLKKKEKLEHASERSPLSQTFQLKKECVDLARDIEIQQMQRVVALLLEPSLSFSTLTAQAFKAAELLNQVQASALSLPRKELHQARLRHLRRSVRYYECDNRNAGGSNSCVEDDSGDGCCETKRRGWRSRNDGNDIGIAKDRNGNKDKIALLDSLMERRYFIIGQISIRDWHRWFSITSFEVRIFFVIIAVISQPASFTNIINFGNVHSVAI